MSGFSVQPATLPPKERWEQLVEQALFWFFRIRRRSTRRLEDDMEIQWLIDEETSDESLLSE